MRERDGPEDEDERGEDDHDGSRGEPPPQSQADFALAAAPASSRRTSGSAASSASRPAAKNDGIFTGRIQPDSPMGGAITRSAPASSLARAAAQQGEAGAQGHGHEGVRGRPARAAVAVHRDDHAAVPRHVAGQRARGPPRTRRRRRGAARPMTMGGKTPGKLHEARTASRTSPLPEHHGLAGVHVGGQDRTGTRSSSKVVTGRNSSMSVAQLGCRRAARRPSRAPTSTDGGATPGPRAGRGPRRPPRPRPPARRR